MNRAELKSRARAELGGNIFQRPWLLALAACAIVSLIKAGIDAFLSVLSIFLLSTVATILLLGPLQYGLSYIFLKQARDHQPLQIGDIFRGFQDDFGGTFLIGLMTNLFTFLWSLLLIVPGIVKAYAYSLAFYVKLDHPDYDWKACINESRRLMRGHKWEAFVLNLSFLGWWIVGALCLVVGTLWVAPYVEATKAQFYEYVRSCDCAPEY